MCLGCCAFAQQPKYLLEGRAQGTTYRIIYQHPTAVVQKQDIDSILHAIDLSMSIYKKESLISSFNKATTREIEMDGMMRDVVRRSFDINKQSKGMFDLTVKPLVSLWGFGPERIRQWPTQGQIDSVMEFVGMDKLKVKGKRLLKKRNEVSIDVNGIAQGYSVDVLARFLDKQHVTSYMVELGGEIKTKGRKEGGETYKVAIERPEGDVESSFVLSLFNKAVTTSGNYRKAFDVDGKKVHHHINPYDGYPLQNNIASVTVIAETAMDADAYDNVFMALPVAEGLKLANSIRNLELYIIYKEGDLFREAFSTGFKKYIQE
ncbi:FAD:protein FMN transferase [Sphingobacterium psychroaquaticum]|uniref:FAD:protein FMN transferase n=1 Tax=Sphingobacterium psychroaquaticum TaxID=561061 RepID=UPI001F10D72D|nr:FAD:protein FMN transferase [Sphingobacterium psychroaquaticum]